MPADQLNGGPSTQADQQAGSANAGGAKAAVTVTVAELLSGNSRYAHGPSITVADTAAHIAALTAGQIESFTKVDFFSATDGMLALSVDQALAVGSNRMASSQVIVSDTAAAIEALTPHELHNLAGVWKFHAVDGTLTLQAAQIGAMMPGQLTSSDEVIASDTGANLSVMFSRRLAGALGPDVDLVHATDGASVTMNADQFHTFRAMLDDSVHVALLDTGWNISYSTDLDDPHVQSIHAMDGMPIRLRNPELLSKLGTGDVVQLILPSLVEGVNITTSQLLDPRIREVTPDTGDATMSVSTLNALTTAGVVLQAPVHVQATAGQDLVSDEAITTASLWLSYNGSGLAGTATAHFAGSVVADGDTFALGGVDRIAHDPTGVWVRDLVSFGQGLGLESGAAPSMEGDEVADAGYALVLGRLDGDLFTADSTGSDTLILWDDDPAAGSVKQCAVVVVGAGELQHWYDETGHALVVGKPEFVWA